MIFKRQIKDHWYTSYRKDGYPHVQTGMILAPERKAEFDPFILMAEDWFKRGTFPDHPHRGFQTVTYVIDGRLEHIDNAGGYGLLDGGDVQYMNAGHAARHAEDAYQDDLIHTLQVWLNLPDRLRTTKTSYQNILKEEAPVVSLDRGQVRVYSGEILGVRGPMQSLVPITMSEITLQAGETYIHQIPENHNAFLYMLAGKMAFGEEEIEIEKSGASLLTYKEDGLEELTSELKIKAITRAKVLVYSGVPIREEFVIGGPFVAKDTAGIEQAFMDYQAGLFGPPAIRE